MMYLVSSTHNLASKLELLQRIQTSDQSDKIIFTNAALNAIMQTKLSTLLTVLHTCYCLDINHTLKQELPRHIAAYSLADFERDITRLPLVCI